MRDPQFVSRNTDADIARRQEIRARFTPEQAAEFGTVESPLPYGGHSTYTPVKAWRFDRDLGTYVQYELAHPALANTPLIQNNNL